MFEDFELDAAARSLKKNGEPVWLNARTFDLLVVLVENRDRVVSKDEILEKVWVGQFVEENNLTVQMSALRKVLGESKNKPRFLVTIPGKGYKFTGIISEPENEKPVITENGKIESSLIEEKDGDLIDNKEDSPEQVKSEPIINGNGPPKNFLTNSDLLQSNGVSPPLAKPERKSIFSKIIWLYLPVMAFLGLLTFFVYYAFFAKAHKTIESIAVLPFVSVGTDPKMDYLSDGMTESLINDLSQSSSLTVIARNSVFRYKVSDAQSSQLDLHAIADTLHVQAILTGRVAQHGDELLISVELVDGTTQTVIWGESYNRKFADVFKVQEELARDITGKLRLKLTGETQQGISKRYTDNIDAFENYTMGRAYISRRTQEDLRTSLRYYEQAINQDQNYALAYTGIAEAYGNLGVRGYISPVEGRQKLQEAAQKAIQLDDSLPQAHVMMGYFYIGYVPYDFSNGDRELRQAIALSPSLAIAHLYLSLSLLRQGNLNEGLSEMKRAQELDPFSAIITRQTALSYILKRDYPRALEIIKQADEIGPAFTTITEIDVYLQMHLYENAIAKLEKEQQQRKDDPILIYSMGAVYAAEGKRVEALKSISELERLSDTKYKQSQWIAKIYALLGNKEQAFTYLEQGLATGELGTFYKDEPIWDSIRNEPRFDSLLKNMGIGL